MFAVPKNGINKRLSSPNHPPTNPPAENTKKETPSLTSTRTSTAAKAPPDPAVLVKNPPLQDQDADSAPEAAAAAMVRPEAMSAEPRA